MKPLSFNAWREPPFSGAWVRVFGYGLAISNTPPLFSERAGYRKTIRIGNWKAVALRPDGVRAK